MRMVLEVGVTSWKWEWLELEVGVARGEGEHGLEVGVARGGGGLESRSGLERGVVWDWCYNHHTTNLCCKVNEFGSDVHGLEGHVPTSRL